jgi:PAS domain S-box-containing protein
MPEMPSQEYTQHRDTVFYTRVAQALACCVVLVSVLNLFAHLGWLPGSAALEVRSALGLLCAALGLFCLSSERQEWRPLRVGMARVLGALIIALGAYTLFQDWIRLDFAIAQFMFPGELGVASQPGKMAPLAAISLMLSGAALFLIDRATDGGSYPAEYCAFAIAAIMSVPLIGYLYGLTTMVPLATPSGVAPQTALGFIALAAGILASRSEHRFMALWNHSAPGGHLLRGLLPKSLLLLVVLDLGVEWGARQGFYGRDYVSPLLVLLTGVWLSVLFWRAASLLNSEFHVRRKGELALLETSALLRAVSDNTPDPIFVKDRSGRIVFANPATFRMLDKSAGEIIGRRGRDIYADLADAEKIDLNDRSVMDSGQPVAVEETVRLSYGIRTFYTTKAPWLNDAGEVVGLVGISTDITERKKMEDALKAHETQLEALVAERTAEVSELIGHLESTREEEKRAIARELHDDLGSALTALNMHLAILFQQMPPDSTLAERSMHIKGLLNSVTQTTRRIQLGLRPDKLDIFGIKTAIAEQAIEFENYAGIPCHASLPDEDLTYAPQLDIALYRMVQESLNNVAKHAHASKVEVILDDNEDSVTLTVRDDGVGMAAGRVGGTLTHGLRGMRERAGYLGGEVRIVSSPGKGTCVIVTIPKNAVAAKTASWSASPAMARAGEAG